MGKKHQDQPGIPTRKVPMESIIDYSMINSKIPLKKYFRGANPTFSKPWTPPSLAVSMNKPAGIPKIVNSHILKAVPAEYSPFFFFLGSLEMLEFPFLHYLLQGCGFVSCHQPAHDDVFQQNHLEWGQDGAAVQHWERNSRNSIRDLRNFSNPIKKKKKHNKKSWFFYSKATTQP